LLFHSQKLDLPIPSFSQAVERFPHTPLVSLVCIENDKYAVDLSVFGIWSSRDLQCYPLQCCRLESQLCTICWSKLASRRIFDIFGRFRFVVYFLHHFHRDSSEERHYWTSLVRGLMGWTALGHGAFRSCRCYRFGP